MNVNVDQGKQERKYHTFLDKTYRVDALPCGISIPFEKELKKVRDSSIEIVNKIEPTTPSDQLYDVLNEYYIDHPDEAYAQILQMVKAVSVITEFFTDGKVDEDYIKENASDEEVHEFINAIQYSQQEKAIKKLRGIGDDLRSLNSRLKK